jgi:RNA-directed DNA polymerase
VRVPDGEGVANHTVPESCARCREAPREALTGVRVGQPSSHESHFSGVPTLLLKRKATRTGALERAPV